MTTPMGVLNVLADKADRVLASRALAMLPATTAPHFARADDRRRMISDLERRAGRLRRGRQKRIPLADTSVEAIAKVLGLNGSR